MDNKRVLLVDGGAALTAGLSQQLARDGGGAAGTVVMHEEQRGPSFKERMEEIDRQWVQRIHTRIRKSEAVKNKDRKGALRIHATGTVEAKLRKEFGGKRTRRILNAERRTGREYPNELKLFEIANVAVPDGKGGQVSEEHERELVRGVDFALVIDGGDLSLVIDDAVKKFRAESELNNGALAGLLAD